MEPTGCQPISAQVLYPDRWLCTHATIPRVTIPDLPAAFTPSRLDTFRASLLSAYAEAGALYDPERGFTEFLCGQVVYHVATSQFDHRLLHDSGGLLTTGRHGPEIWMDGLRVRWAKVGRNASDAIATALPRRSAAANDMAQGNDQLSLWSDESQPETPNWFLAHVGNPRDGLIRLYLAAPATANGRDITGWLRWFAIYDQEQPAVEFPSAPAPGLPEREPYGPLEVTLVDDAEANASLADWQA
jgi:hypothetical protein